MTCIGLLLGHAIAAIVASASTDRVGNIEARPLMEKGLGCPVNQPSDPRTYAWCASAWPQRVAASMSDSNGTALGFVTFFRMRMSVGNTFVRP